MADLLRIAGLRAGYGEAVVLPQMSLTLPEGQVLALLGRNGTGKTTLDQLHRRYHPPFRWDARAWRFRHHRVAPRSAGAGRDRLGAAGAQHLPLAHRGREYDRGGATRAVDRGARLPDVSAPERAADQFRQPALRRRAADAGHRPSADLEPESAAAGRADRGAGAHHCRGIVESVGHDYTFGRHLLRHRRAERAKDSGVGRPRCDIGARNDRA